MRHVVFFSGGVCSYCAAKRVIAKYGKENVTLLFTDTLIEDKDLYRFIDEAVDKLSAEYVRLADGRTPFEVYRDSRLLGNSRIAPCSHILKQKVSSKYIKEHYSPEDTVLYLGLDWSESHRFESPRKHWAPYKVEYPMGDAPYLSKEGMMAELKADGITAPRLYAMGFSHNNCGGFCCRAGQGHFARLLEKLPETFARAEHEEEAMREYLGRDIAFMKKTIHGKVVPYTLKQLKQDIEARCEIDLFDIGGCGCFSYEEKEKN